MNARRKRVRCRKQARGSPLSSHFWGRFLRTFGDIREKKKKWQKKLQMQLGVQDNGRILWYHVGTGEEKRKRGSFPIAPVTGGETMTNEELLSAISQMIQDFRKEVNERFERLEAAQAETNERLVRLEASQAETNERLAKLEASQAETNERLAKLEAAQEETNERLTKLEEGQAVLMKRTAMLLEHMQQMDGRVRSLETSLTIFRNEFRIYRDKAELEEQKKRNLFVEFFKLMYDQHEEHWKKTERNTQKLEAISLTVEEHTKRLKEYDVWFRKLFPEYSGSAAAAV